MTRTHIPIGDGLADHFVGKLGHVHDTAPPGFFYYYWYFYTFCYCLSFFVIVNVHDNAPPIFFIIGIIILFVIV